MNAICPTCSSVYNGNSQFCSRPCMIGYVPEEEDEEQTPLPTPTRVTLKRSYAYVPGMSDAEHAAMSARLDIENEACGLAVGGSPASLVPTSLVFGIQDAVASASATPARKKRSREDLVKPTTKVKKQRKRQVTAVRKNYGDTQLWEITLEDGTTRLAKEITFDTIPSFM